MPVLAKISMNSSHTTSTLVIEGMDANRAFTTNFMPSFLEIILNGLNALKALKALSEFSC